MNTPLKLIGPLSLCLIASSAFAAVDHQWEFQDASPVLLENAANTGAVGGVSFASGLTNLTDGSDLYVVNSGVNGFKAANISDISTGQAYYRMDIEGWDQDDNASFRNLTFHLRDDSAGENIVDFQMNQQGNGLLRFRYSDNNGTTNQVIAGYDTGDLSQVTSNAYSIVLGLDVVTGNYNISISTDGGLNYVEEVTGTASPVAVTSIRFAQNGDYSTNDDFVNIGYLGLSDDAADFGVNAVVPEPSSYALFSSGLVFFFMMLRRRRA